MTFVSYGQNFEDVILYRALSDVDRGFYVDIGAHDPTQDSVTKAFYDRGWTGINVEPVRYWYERLKQQRQKDTNLRVAVDEHCGTKVFYEVADTGLSTLREDIARRHSQKGYAVRSYEVPVRTLDSILGKYSADVIHFLKIDVEGAEASVLKSLNLSKTRPWILVVEATEPLTTQSSQEEWHDWLSQNNYECVYSDGINRFYLAFEKMEKKSAFQHPPNVFDAFISYTAWDARKNMDAMSEALTQANYNLEVSRRELHGLYDSMSWRITRPFRVLKQWGGSAGPGIRRSWAVALRKGRILVRFALRGLIGQVSRVPGMRPCMARVLNVCPSLKDRLRSLMAAPRDPYVPSIGGFARVPEDESSLTKSGRAAYRVLADSLDKRDR